MREVVIVSGARTPVGDFMGSLAEYDPIDLGCLLSKALWKAGITADLIDEVVAGHCNQSSSRATVPAMWH